MVVVDGYCSVFISHMLTRGHSLTPAHSSATVSLSLEQPPVLHSSGSRYLFLCMSYNNVEVAVGADDIVITLEGRRRGAT